VRYLAGTGILINGYRMLSGKPRGKGNTGVDHWIILNIIL
jgi:hypothetical protein